MWLSLSDGGDSIRMWIQSGLCPLRTKVQPLCPLLYSTMGIVGLAVALDEWLANIQQHIMR
jgi:hypothetical protein